MLDVLDDVRFVTAETAVRRVFARTPPETLAGWDRTAIPPHKLYRYVTGQATSSRHLRGDDA